MATSKKQLWISAAVGVCVGVAYSVFKPELYRGWRSLSPPRAPALRFYKQISVKSTMPDPDDQDRPEFAIAISPQTETEPLQIIKIRRDPSSCRWTASTETVERAGKTERLDPMDLKCDDGFRASETYNFESDQTRFSVLSRSAKVVSKLPPEKDPASGEPPPPPPPSKENSCPGSTTELFSVVLNERVVEFTETPSLDFSGPKDKVCASNSVTTTLYLFVGALAEVLNQSPEAAAKLKEGLKNGEK